MGVSVCVVIVGLRPVCQVETKCVLIAKFDHRNRIASDSPVKHVLHLAYKRSFQAISFR